MKIRHSKRNSIGWLGFNLTLNYTFPRVYILQESKYPSHSIKLDVQNEIEYENYTFKMKIRHSK